MQLDEVFGDRQPQPQAPCLARRRRISLTESLEHMRKKFGRDALPIVADGDTYAAAGRHGAYLDAAARWSELDAVVEQVPENLLNASGVGGDRRQTGFYER